VIGIVVYLYFLLHMVYIGGVWGYTPECALFSTTCYYVHSVRAYWLAEDFEL